MSSKRISRKMKQQVAVQLDLVEKFLLDVIRHPEKLDKMPDKATLVLFPVKVEQRRKAA